MLEHTNKHKNSGKAHSQRGSKRQELVRNKPRPVELVWFFSPLPAAASACGAGAAREMVAKAAKTSWLG